MLKNKRLLDAVFFVTLKDSGKTKIIFKRAVNLSRSLLLCTIFGILDLILYSCTRPLTIHFFRKKEHERLQINY